MNGRMLIAHGSRAVRTILRRRALAEAPEFAIVEVESEDEALDALSDCSFDLVVCDEAMVGARGQTWADRLLAMGCSRSIGFLYVVSEATSMSRRAELLGHGTSALIDATFSSADIGAAIARVFDPRRQRERRRVAIPGSRAFIRIGSRDVSSTIVNFSESGMLCEFATPPEFAPILYPSDVSISFPEYAGSFEVRGIRARVLRIYVVTHGADSWAERLRGAWQFINVPPPAAQILRQVIEQADAEDEAAPQSSFERGLPERGNVRGS